MLVGTTAISPAMIHLLTGAGIRCLLFENQIPNDYDKTAGNPTV
jgi:hypothetical protein